METQYPKIAETITTDQRNRVAAIDCHIEELLKIIVENCPDGPEQANALGALETTKLWARLAVVKDDQ